MQPRRCDAFPRNGAAGPGWQAATVADGRRVPETDAPRWRKCASWMQGRPEGRQTKARHRRVAGWRPDEGREGVRFPSIQACFTLSTVANKPEDQQNDQRGFNNP